MKQTLTAEQLKALQDWAKVYGRNWKTPLRDAWMDGDYHGFKDCNYLQQIRNTFGPSWLVSFRLPAPENTFQNDRSERAGSFYVS